MSFTIQPEPSTLQFDREGVCRIGGTRVTLKTVIEAFLRGATAEDIADSFPSLALADVYSAIAYYLRHREEVGAYLDAAKEKQAEIIRQIEAQAPRAEFRERLLARRKLVSR